MTSTAKSAVKFILRKAGYEVRRLQPNLTYLAEMPHAKLHPLSTYSPWLADEAFIQTFNMIKTYTMVDLYRCYELWQLIDQVAKLETGDLIEVGVWRGGTGCLMAKKCQLARINVSIHLCDTFKGVVKAGELDTAYSGGEHADTSEQVVSDLIRKLRLNNAQVLKGVFPDDTGSLIENSTFRFCHIDVDVYQSAKDIIEWIWRRLVTGAVVVYDDYGFSGCEGITRLVNDERRSADRIVVHNLNGHAVVVKIK
jgi:predicted O-methyltransferase YrrM